MVNCIKGKIDVQFLVIAGCLSITNSANSWIGLKIWTKYKVMKWTVLEDFDNDIFQKIILQTFRNVRKNKDTSFPHIAENRVAKCPNNL